MHEEQTVVTRLLLAHQLQKAQVEQARIHLNLMVAVAVVLVQDLFRLKVVV